MWNVYTMEYYSAIKKKNEIMPFAATEMDLEMIILSERQIYRSYMELKKKDTNELICKQK